MLTGMITDDGYGQQPRTNAWSIRGAAETSGLEARPSLSFRIPVAPAADMFADMSQN